MSSGEWIAHDGKGMPVAGEAMVLCRFADGTDEEFEGMPPSRADYWGGDGGDYWSAIGRICAITHYKVIAND